MKKEKTSANTHKNNQTPNVKKYSKIKLGIDVHADSYSVVRQIDSATPQPAQKMSPDKFLDFAKKQLELAQEVHSCYEAGPFGYSLHRALLKMGIKNVVVRPQPARMHERFMECGGTGEKGARHRFCQTRQ